jgi:chemotaxis receptor (MCP) glutamine deamidase CheD
MGSTRDTLRLLVAGGASVLGGHDPFKIGERNTKATLDTLARLGYSVRHTIVGGGVNRALHLDIDRGHVMLITPSEGGQFLLS